VGAHELDVVVLDDYEAHRHSSRFDSVVEFGCSRLLRFDSWRAESETRFVPAGVRQQRAPHTLLFQDACRDRRPPQSGAFAVERDGTVEKSRGTRGRVPGDVPWDIHSASTGRNAIAPVAWPATQNGQHGAPPRVD